MPLIKSCSLEAFRQNISAEIRAGRDPKQAAAIAHDTLRRACKEAGKAVPKTDGAEDGIHVKRYDSGEFTSPTKTPNGYLRCDAKITRVGVFKYKLADGKTRAELRIPEEVFTEDSLASFEDVPLTNEHPREKLTAKNTRRFQAGNVKRVRKHDRHVAANVLITDEDAIKDAENGKTQLSCGYTCDLDFTPGVTSGIPGVSDGQRFDAIQRNIVGNHVAIVNKGRAGAETALHLDGDDAIMILDPDPEPTGPQPGPGGKPMATLRIDEVDYEISEQAHQAVSKIMTRIDEVSQRREAIEKELSEEKARADKAEEDLEAEKKAHKEDSSDEVIQKAVKARVSLERSAAEILKDDSLKLDEMSEGDIKKAVILKVSPGAREKLDSADDAYLFARFDAAVESWKEDQKKKPKPAHQVRKATDAPGDMRFDSKAARQRMLEENYKMGREPIQATNPNQ
jgi:hypothetical protein